MAGIIWRIFKKSAIFFPAIIKPAIIKPAKLFEAGFKFICIFLQFYTNLRIFGDFLQEWFGKLTDDWLALYFNSFYGLVWFKFYKKSAKNDTFVKIWYNLKWIFMAEDIYGGDNLADFGKFRHIFPRHK